MMGTDCSVHFGKLQGDVIMIDIGMRDWLPYLFQLERHNS